MSILSYYEMIVVNDECRSEIAENSTAEIFTHNNDSFDVMLPKRWIGKFMPKREANVHDSPSNLIAFGFGVRAFDEPFRDGFSSYFFGGVMR